MITIKNKKEIQNMKTSCKILANVKKILYNKMKQGISGLTLDKIAEREIIKRKAKPAFKGYQGFKHSICISFNEQLIHGIPSQRKLKNGDLVKLDIGCVYQGMHADSAFTKAVGNTSQQDHLLITVAKEAFWAGVKAITKGSRVGDISAAIWKVINGYNLYVPKNFSGHGIGYDLHEEPYVYNKGKSGTGALLKDGMVICIEPMILQKSNQIKILDNGWTVVSSEKLKTAHYEHTVLITNGKGTILTKGI